MNERHRAVISWTASEAGGRKAPPTGPRYITVVRFEEDGNWQHGAWSLVVEWIRTFRQGQQTLAEVSFLAPDAPSHLLKPGSRFELLEGSRRVAKGIILPISVPVPEELNDFELALIG